ncbi:MAG: hypothetical protein HUJ98_02030 [Bacteroidaceae bacterium]|nr:hypothetical protein [Bacteroidaceae bacterium]MCF0185251.1 hypothetical protein [Bacteroidaceae bacterium]
MNDKEYLNHYESVFAKALHSFLQSKDEVGEMMPDNPDIDERWEGIMQSYLPDGVREFNGYPMVSLGWMMFVGMAVAQLWDDDWEKYSKVADLYTMLRDVRGYDCMDEYICEEVLKLDAEAAKITSKLVGDASTIAHRSLMHEGFEPGTPEAFHAYVRVLHQLYLSGAAIQLKRMGYHMEQLSL